VQEEHGIPTPSSSDELEPGGLFFSLQWVGAPFMNRICKENPSRALKYWQFSSKICTPIGMASSLYFSQRQNNMAAFWVTIPVTVRLLQHISAYYQKGVTRFGSCH
jgi:hypothetical protein